MSEESNRTWYYAKQDGNKFGPYSEEEIIKLIRNGIITANDFIWMVDLDNWVLLGDSIYSFYLGN